MQEARSKKQKFTWPLVILVTILLVGSYFRFTNLNWDEGQWIHPDEGHMRMINSVIRMPDSLSLYFDTHNSPLNCRNQGYQYSYGTLPLFLTRLAGEWLDRACGESPAKLSVAVAWLLVGPLVAECSPGAFTGFYSALVGRAFSALADLGTVFLIYLIGRRLYGEAVGLLAAGLGALTAFSIQQAHFFTVDSMACFFVTLTAYFSVRARQSASGALSPRAEGPPR
nr:phospholipid carrier-dependent glycosyltransferase [Anaerolineae bacterium]